MPFRYLVSLKPLILGLGSDSTISPATACTTVSSLSYWGWAQTRTRRRCSPGRWSQASHIGAGLRPQNTLRSFFTKRLKPLILGLGSDATDLAVTTNCARLDPLILGQGSDKGRGVFIEFIDGVSIPIILGQGSDSSESLSSSSESCLNPLILGQGSDPPQRQNHIPNPRLNPLILGQGSDGKYLQFKFQILVSIPSYWGRVQTRGNAYQVSKHGSLNPLILGQGSDRPMIKLAIAYISLNPLILGQGSDDYYLSGNGETLVSIPSYWGRVQTFPQKKANKK